MDNILVLKELFFSSYCGITFKETGITMYTVFVPFKFLSRCLVSYIGFDLDGIRNNAFKTNSGSLSDNVTIDHVQLKKLELEHLKS